MSTSANAGCAPAVAGGGKWAPWRAATIAPPARGASRAALVPGAQVHAPEPAAAAPALDPAELDRIRQQAHDAAAAEGRREGLAAGREEGYAAGLATGQDEMRAQARQLQALAAALPAALRGVDEALSRTLLDLALEIARQVVHRSLAIKPELLVPVVRELLHGEISRDGAPQLVIHPADAEVVRSAMPGELEAAGWEVVPDQSIARGGCMVRCGAGVRDARLPTRWDRVAEAVALDEAPS